MSLNFLEGTEKNYKTFSGKDFWARYLTCIFRKRSRTTRPLRTTYDHFKMVFWAITPNSVTVKRRQYVASKRQNEIIIQCSTTSQKFISWVVPGMKHWKLTAINLLYFVAKVRFSKRNVNIWTLWIWALEERQVQKQPIKEKKKRFRELFYWSGRRIEKEAGTGRRGWVGKRLLPLADVQIMVLLGSLV